MILERYYHSISFKASKVRSTPLKCLESGSERYNKFRIKTGIKRLRGQRGRAMVGIFITSLNYQTYVLTAAARKRNTEEPSERTGMQNLQTDRGRSVKLEKCCLFQF